jgi:hypothetical protein
MESGDGFAMPAHTPLNRKDPLFHLDPELHVFWTAIATTACS